MSNITLFSPANVPAFARNNELSDTARALSGGAPNNKRISIRGGVFRLLTGGKEIAAIDDRHLEIVIVKAAPKIGRVFYADKYDADNSTPPTCYSTDGERPDNSVRVKQSDNCVQCAQNVAGSGNGNSRACRYEQRLAVILADKPEGDVLQLTLPATSLFGSKEGDKRPLQEYARYLAAQTPPVNPEQIVTEMRFDTKSEYPKLFFKPVRWLTDDEYEISKTQAASVDAQRAVDMPEAQIDGVQPRMDIPGTPTKSTPAPEAEKPKAPPKSAKKVSAVPAADADADADKEPEVRKEAPPAAVPTKKATLADIVADWGDE
jgi:hypothetical protein